MSLPDSHPPIHEHGRSCPITSQKNAFCPAQKGDIRSACPALNTMANHGYIGRDGKNLSAMDIVRGLMACYGLSIPLSLLLSFGGFFMLRKFSRITLHEIGKHDVIEHDASLVHHDTPTGHTFAPIHVDHSLVDDLVSDVRPPQADIEKSLDTPFLMNYEDVARSRIRREAECPELDSLHREIARGEMAIILGVWEIKTQSKIGIPVDYLRQWIAQERLPDDWKPTHKQGLLNVMKRSKTIRLAMEQMRKEQTPTKAG